MGDGQSVVVLKIGDWCLFGNRVVNVVTSELKGGRYLVMYKHNGEAFYSYANPTHLTLLPEGLNPILSDSISIKEKL